MRYNREFAFVEKLLKNSGVKLRYITEHPSEKFPEPQDVGLQDILNYTIDNTIVFQMLKDQCRPNIIYRMKNVLLCNYIVFQLPDTAQSVYAYIGPYTFSPVSKQDILRLAERFHVTPGNLLQLEQFYMDLPQISDENLLLSLLYTLGEYLWDDAEHFSISDNLPFPLQPPDDFTPIADVQTPDDSLLSIQIIEQRYEVEQQLMQAVTSGHIHKAELALSRLTSRQFESRTDNPIRNLKNYAIILNTLLRKAAENATVHPIHIHQISSQYAKRIELITSYISFSALIREMIRKYCLMVKNYSLKGYSLLIRKVITNINYDLTADLGLKNLAAGLNINASYLSTLFRKETGSTLTEYVNHKRIEYALLLLNSTDMQIQAVAVHCGIPDVNYFTKIFKKIIGKTPKEYRDMITSHK